MNKINLNQMENLTGGLCIYGGPGSSNGNSNVTCTGLCLSEWLAYAASGGSSPAPTIAC